MSEELMGRRKLPCKQEIESGRFNHHRKKEGTFTGLLRSRDETVSITGFLQRHQELTLRSPSRALSSEKALSWESEWLFRHRDKCMFPSGKRFPGQKINEAQEQ